MNQPSVGWEMEEGLWDQGTGSKRSMESKWNVRGRRCEMGMKSRMNRYRRRRKSRKSMRSGKNTRNAKWKRKWGTYRATAHVRRGVIAEGRMMRERTWEWMHDNGSQGVHVEEEAG